MRLRLSILTLFVPLVIFAQQKAVVGVSASYLRAQPDYESPLETQELMGQVVTVLDSDRYWRKVQTSQPYTAWTTEKTLTMLSEAEIATYEKATKYIVTALQTTAYDASPKVHKAGFKVGKKGEPKARYNGEATQVCDLVCGNLLRVEFRGDKVLRQGGFCAALLPDGRRVWVRKGDVEEYGAWQTECKKMGAEQVTKRAIQYAKGMLGVPYLWGGMSPKGLDCSGLVRVAYMMAGKSLPRNASQQFAAGREISVAQGDLSALLPGDLVFFGRTRENGSLVITHVGIYLGGGEMIHSSQLVRINSLESDSPHCYENISRLCKACRIVE